MGDDQGQEYLNIFSERGYMSAINTPTGVQGNHSFCIDHMFVRSKIPEEKFCPIVWRSRLTDHYSVLLGINLSENHISCDSDAILNYRKLINYSKLKNILAEESWEQIDDCESPELAADKLVENLNHYSALSTVKIKIRKETINRKL
ncbi:hypothetical protein HHI36_019834 [Cryptolaemus montrouzieri]|uniref:Uncharacterized protein n=1 Tax=Cryptolaemus montrouzieri TaxID=559131 RepID=A0ABD2N8X8_9CUCU